jgi:hypothetical protein
LSLKYLSVTSIKNLETIQTLVDFESLVTLRIDASRIKLLPDLRNLKNLSKLELGYMKVWENPEILQTLPNLQELRLHEINSKLKAERFYFLTEMNTLKSIDFRFMDFNEKRIKTLANKFVEMGKENMLKR